MRLKFPYVIISARQGRGYGFDKISDGIDKSLQEAIRTKWAPPGNRWSQYIGARFTRMILLPNNHCGWVQGRVTRSQDEFGRRGLLWAKVVVVPQSRISRLVQDYISTLKRPALAAGRSLVPERIGLYWRTVRMRQTIFAAPTAQLSKLRTMEYVILRSYLSLPSILRNRTTFDTLALAAKGAGTLVGMPFESEKCQAHIKL